ncbi:MAG: hypothetical protein HQL63_05535 [Magnetococcales bacterium]|nr:hypothetical protein [Magnetococcales bacterium]
MAISFSSIGSYSTLGSLLSSRYGVTSQGSSAAWNNTLATLGSSSGNAAAFKLGNNLTTAIKSYGQAISSSNDGVSRIQIAQEGLGRINDNMTKLKDLATQASSTTITQTDRDKLQAAADKIQKENDQIISTTKFGSEKLLASKHSDSVQSGVNSWNTTSISFKDFSKSFAKVDLSSQQGASDALDTLKTNMATAGKGVADLSKTRAKLESSLNTMTQASNSLSNARDVTLSLGSQGGLGSGSLFGSQGGIDSMRVLQLLG